MFCTNCGAEVTGNFCPNCGAPAHPAVPRPADAAQPAEAAQSAEKVYPEPPLGKYAACMDSWVELRPDSIYIHKNNRENRKSYESNLTVPYSDIAAVSFDVGGKKGKTFVICLRTKDNAHIPFARDKQFLSDPLCIAIQNKKKSVQEEGDVYTIYNFLSKVAKINAYPIPERASLPKDFKFKSLAGPVEAAEPFPAEERVVYEGRRSRVAHCPKCGSASLIANRRGLFSFGEPVEGEFSAGGAVVAGSSKMKITCLNCGHSWKI